MNKKFKALVKVIEDRPGTNTVEAKGLPEKSTEVIMRGK